MATGSYAPFVAFTIFDNDGILPGAKLYSFVAGTTIPTPTFTDVGLTTPNTNPVIADAGGRMTVILAPGQAYKLEATTPDGTVIWTRDHIIGPTSATGVLGTAGVDLAAGVVVFLSDGSGGLTAGRWYLADADLAYASITPIIGITPAAIQSGQQGTVTILGQATGLSALVTGEWYYVSPTAGELTATAPSPHVRVVGVADSPTTLIITGGRPSDAVMPVREDPTNSGSIATVPLPPGSGPLTVVFTNPVKLDVLGFTPGLDGQVLRCYSRGAGQVDFYHENPSNPTPASRLHLMVTFITCATSLSAGVGTATFQYDGLEQRWRLVQHEQGDWITPAFTAADYTGTGAMTWTVDLADVVRCAYRLNGTTLQVSLTLFTTTVGGAPDFSLVRTIPGGYQAAGDEYLAVLVIDAGAPAVYGRCLVTGTQLKFFTTPAASALWSLSADATYILGLFTFEVQ